MKRLPVLHVFRTASHEYGTPWPGDSGTVAASEGDVVDVPFLVVFVHWPVLAVKLYPLGQLSHWPRSGPLETYE